MSNHDDVRDPEFELIVAYASGTASPEETSAVERSPSLRALAGRIRGVIDALRADGLESASSEAIRAACALLPHADTRAEASAGGTPTPAGAPSLAEWLDRAAMVVASLVFDGRRPDAAAGWRSGGAARQRSYEWKDGRVDLQVTGTERRIIRGQATVRSGDRALDAVLVAGVERSIVASADVDDHGRFRLETDPGSFDLVLRVGAPDAPDASAGIVMTDLDVA